MNKSGIGLGLVISQQIVNMFDGKIGFESEHNVGSCFTFSFMLEEDKSEEIKSDQVERVQFDIDSSNLHFYWKPDFSQMITNKPSEIRYITDIINILDA